LDIPLVHEPFSIRAVAWVIIVKGQTTAISLSAGLVSTLQRGDNPIARGESSAKRFAHGRPEAQAESVGILAGQCNRGLFRSQRRGKNVLSFHEFCQKSELA
jgi:hypothetical protein